MSGAPVRLQGVTKRFGDVTAVDAVDLEVRPGELLAVVGPSGCGKSTMLRLIAGLAAPDEGTIELDGVTVAGDGVWVPPEKRHVGIVFQDHALFPHLDVAGNVGFGLDRRHPDRGGRIAEVLSLVGLDTMADRYPHELSGGEQQRVALARALAPSPVVILLDEPFSNLDRNLRTQVRDDTAAVLRAAGASGLFVTHDQDEALSVGDRIAVAHRGTVQQVDTPDAVFHAPATRFVATFMGEADFVAGRVRDDGGVDTALGPVTTTVAGPGPVEVMVRPHDVEVVTDGHGNAVVERTEFRGATVLHHLRLDDGSAVRALRPHDAALAAGTRVTATTSPAHPLVSFAATTSD